MQGFNHLKVHPQRDLSNKLCRARNCKIVFLLFTAREYLMMEQLQIITHLHMPLFYVNYGKHLVIKSPTKAMNLKNTYIIGPLSRNFENANSICVLFLPWPINIFRSFGIQHGSRKSVVVV